jgi:hypothetical protein
MRRVSESSRPDHRSSPRRFEGCGAENRGLHGHNFRMSARRKIFPENSCGPHAPPSMIVSCRIRAGAIASILVIRGAQLIGNVRTLSMDGLISRVHA